MFVCADEGRVSHRQHVCECVSLSVFVRKTERVWECKRHVEGGGRFQVTKEVN